MNEQETRELVEQAIENGYIDYDRMGDVKLYYKDFEFWLTYFYGIDIVFRQYGEIWFNFFESEELYNKLKSIFKVWEAI